MSIYDERGNWNKKALKIKSDDTKHYPNNDEASLLRKIIVDSGLTEDEVRSIKKYRIMLSEAQKQSQLPKRNSVKKFYQGLIKDACKKTGLVPQHPETIKVIDELIKKYQSGRKRFWYSYNIGRSSNECGKSIVKKYAK